MIEKVLQQIAILPYSFEKPQSSIAKIDGSSPAIDHKHVVHILPPTYELGRTRSPMCR